MQGKNNNCHGFIIDFFLHTVPTAPPQNVTIMEISALSVTLSWSALPKEHQNGLITGYTITVYEGTEKKQEKAVTDVNGTTVSSLSGNTHYTLYMAAKTCVGIGPYSDAVHFKTKIYGKKIVRQWNH